MLFYITVLYVIMKNKLLIIRYQEREVKDRMFHVKHTKESITDKYYG